ncbi:MAG: ABC transporter permease [Armatimonadota bacterium]
MSKSTALSACNGLLWMLIALAACAGIVLIAGASPVAVAQALVQGATGTQYNISNTFVQTIPLLVTALAVIVAFRAEMFNIGVEGQFLLGAVLACWAGQLAAPGPLAVIVTLVASMFGGALWALIPAIMLHFRGVQIVLSSLIMNFIAVQVVAWVVRGPLQEAVREYPQSDPIRAAAELPKVVSGLQLHTGIWIALALAVIFDMLLRFTVFGQQLKAIGNGLRASKTMGLPVSRILVSTVLISGALGGLAGGIQIAGVTHFLADPYSKGYGYTAIAVALLARLSPVGAIPAALLFGALTSGSSAAQSAGIPVVVLQVIQAVILFSILGARFTRTLLAKSGAKS